MYKEILSYPNLALTNILDDSEYYNEACHYRSSAFAASFEAAISLTHSLLSLHFFRWTYCVWSYFSTRLLHCVVFISNQFLHALYSSWCDTYTTSNSYFADLNIYSKSILSWKVKHIVTAETEQYMPCTAFRCTLYEYFVASWNTNTLLKVTFHISSIYAPNVLAFFTSWAHSVCTWSEFIFITTRTEQSSKYWGNRNYNQNKFWFDLYLF